MRSSRPLVIAHRGYSGRFPENTLAAFGGAIEAGAEMIELDVHFSRDGELLVTHDFELGRTCSGTGTLLDLDGAQLRRLDAGSWFSPRFSGERIPLLQQVLALARGKLPLNVELKDETVATPARRAEFARACLGAVEEAGMREHVVFSSFNWELLRALRCLSPQAKLGLLNHAPERGLQLQTAADLRAFSYHPNHEPLTAPMLEDLHAAGLRVFPYTVNSEPAFRRLVSLGVQGIITNEVEALRAYFDARFG